MIDAALVGTALASEAFWAAVRKGYNTPYNDPPPRGAPGIAAAARVAIDPEPLPVAAMAAVVAAEAHPG